MRANQPAIAQAGRAEAASGVAVYRAAARATLIAGHILGIRRRRKWRAAHIMKRPSASETSAARRFVTCAQPAPNSSQGERRQA